MTEQSFPEFGQWLREKREDAGLSLREIAEKTRIPQSILEAIEAGDGSRLPAPVFIKGFLRTLAIELNLDPVDLIGEFKRAVPEPEEGVAVPITARKDLDADSRYGGTIIFFVVLAVIIVIAYFIVPWKSISGWFGSSTPEQAEVSEPAPTKEPVVAVTREVNTTTSTTVSTTTTSTSTVAEVTEPEPGSEPEPAPQPEPQASPEQPRRLRRRNRSSVGGGTGGR